MKNRIRFLSEGKKYSKSYLFSIELDNLNSLVKGNVCKYINNEVVTFNYVGYIKSKTNIYFVLPKYLNDKISENEKIAEVTLLTRTFIKYASFKEFEEGDFLNFNKDDIEISEVALAKLLLDDYFNYGLYLEEKRESKLGDIGEINWIKTLEKEDIAICKRKPFYINLHRDINVISENIITKIHKWAINYCLGEFGAIFGYKIQRIDINNFPLKQIGNKDLLLRSINNELNNVYLDRKVSLLKMLKALIIRTLASENNISLFGTSSFEVIWEKVCGSAFTNQVDYYKKFIPNPIWKSKDGNSINEKTFRPDIIRFIKNDNLFFILDAKYYKIKFTERGMVNNPGIQDVSKQLLYEIVLKNVEIHSKKYNIFLFPSENNDKLYEIFGTVSIEVINANPIYLIYLSPRKILNMYINNNVFDRKTLLELTESIELFGKELQNSPSK